MLYWKNISRIAKKILIFVVKLGVAVGLFFWLYTENRLDFSWLKSIRLDAHTTLLLILGATSVFLGLFLTAWRLKLFLFYQRFNLPYKLVFSLTLIGSFFGAVLPGLAGGDAVKAAYICSNVSERRSDAFAAVLIDRMIGLYSLFVLGTLTVIIAWTIDALPFDSVFVFTAPGAVVLLGLGLFLVAWDGFFNSRPVQTIMVAAPKMIQNLVSAIRVCLKSPRLVLTAIVLSVLNHSLVVVSFIVGAVLLDDLLPLYTHFVLGPLAMVMNAIPLTPGGIGMAEGALSFLFQAAGSFNGATVGLAGRVIQYFVFASGGCIALTFLKLRFRIHTVNEEDIKYIPEVKIP
jgi:glycosyltransferase 2 family protein